MTRSIIELDLGEVVGRDLPWEQFAGAHMLVTGANGMLPSYVLRTLLRLNDTRDLGITAYALVRNEEKARRLIGDVLGRDDVHLLVQDVADPIALDVAFDYVVHGASPARPVLHSADPVGTIKANLQGTFALLDRCVRDASRGFALMSSAEVYGRQASDVDLIDEHSYGPFDFVTPRASYSEGKRAAETICAAYAAQYGLHCTIARFGHVYGPGMALDDGRVQADFARNVVEGRDIVLNSDGTAVRTYTYVADAVAGLFFAMLKGTEPAYNIADARGLVAIRELATLFTRTRPDRGLKLTFTDPADGRAFSQAKGQGLSSVRLEGLGWQPLVDLPTGLDRMVTSLEQA